MSKKQKDKAHLPLNKYVELCVEQYFKDLDGECPVGLYDRVMAEVEKPLIEVVMKKNLGNQTRTAKMLGINRNTLRKKLEQYSIIY